MQGLWVRHLLQFTTDQPAPGFGVHICDAEVDKETGDHHHPLHRDSGCGKAIHPDYVEGQTQAVRQHGWALNEEYVYNAHGVLEPGFPRLSIPVVSDLPFIDAVIVEVPNLPYPFGVKGVERC